MHDFDQYLLDHLPWFDDHVSLDNPALTFLRKELTHRASAATEFGLLFRREQDKIGAAMISALGLLDEEISDPWGYSYLTFGLLSSQIELRRAAVSSLRRWGSVKSWKLLVMHQDEEEGPELRREIALAVDAIEQSLDYAIM